MSTYTTQLLPFGEEESIKQAVEALQNGLPVVFPTDTVYGVGVDPFNGAAIERLYEAKQRPMDKGLPILIDQVSNLKQIAQVVPLQATVWGERYWPGPLTVIVPKRKSLPKQLSPNHGVAVRIPDLRQTCELIRQLDGAIATTSANISSQPAALTAEEAYAQLNGRVPIILDGGRVQGGTASTIVSLLDERPTLIRKGPIDPHDLGIV